MSDVTLQETIEQLVLARLLVASPKSIDRAELQKALSPLFVHRLDADRWAADFNTGLARLLANGHISDPPLSLTDAGRARTMSYWNMVTLPARPRWESLVRDVLVPRILQFSRDQQAAKDKSKGLVATVLKNRYALGNDVGSTPAALVTALAWRQLGVESTARFTPEAVVAATLLQTTTKTTAQGVVRRLASRVLDVPEGELFDGALRQWIGAAEECRVDFSPPGTAHGWTEVHRTANSLPQFAADVAAAAVRTATGRFGPNKIFISHVYRQLSQSAPYAELHLADFKSRLLEAHRRGLLALSRADLVERMSPADLTDSEITYFDATFHFLILK